MKIIESHPDWDPQEGERVRMTSGTPFPTAIAVVDKVRREEYGTIYDVTTVFFGRKASVVRQGIRPVE